MIPFFSGLAPIFCSLRLRQPVRLHCSTSKSHSMQRFCGCYISGFCREFICVRDASRRPMFLSLFFRSSGKWCFLDKGRVSKGRLQARACCPNFGSNRNKCIFIMVCFVLGRSFCEFAPHILFQLSGTQIDFRVTEENLNEWVLLYKPQKICDILLHFSDWTS